jgi:hypothetical protein
MHELLAREADLEEVACRADTAAMTRASQAAY